MQSAGEWVCVYVFAHKLSVPVITRSASAPHALLYSTWLALDSESCCCQSRSKSHLCAKWKELCAPNVTSHRYKTVHVVCAPFLLFSPLTESTFFSASWTCEWYGAGLDKQNYWHLHFRKWVLNSRLVNISKVPKSRIFYYIAEDKVGATKSVPQLFKQQHFHKSYHLKWKIKAGKCMYLPLLFMCWIFY